MKILYIKLKHLGLRDSSVAGALAAQFPAPTLYLAIPHHSRSRVPDTLLFSPQQPDRHVMHRYTCRRNSHAHKNKS